MWRCSITMIVANIWLGGCAFGGGDDDSNVCTSSAQCGPRQVCNLVARRCEPAPELGEGQLVATFDCPRFDLGATEPGTARMQARFGGEDVDLGVGCFGRISNGLVKVTLVGGDPAGGRSVDVVALPGGDLPASLMIPTEAAAWLEQLDADFVTHPWAWATSGSVQLDEASDQRIRGALDVQLEPVVARGGVCNDTTLLGACGSPGSGVTCVLEDPSGDPACRAVCTTEEDCEGDEACVDVSGLPLCIPDALVTTGDPLCSGPAGDECASDRTCVRGAIGDTTGRYCRVSCALESAPSCPDGQVCATLYQGGQPTSNGACFPDPCDASACGVGQGCKPTSATESTCVSSARITGTFAVTVSAPESPVMGTGTASGGYPGATFPANGRAISIILSGDNPYLAVALGSTDDSDPARVLLILMPVYTAVPNRDLVPIWEVIAEVRRGETTLATAIDGYVHFVAVGTSVGARVAGRFAFDFCEGGEP